MGPSCNFCNTRCFVPITDDLWARMTEAQRNLYALENAQGLKVTIIATCPGGQAFEKEHMGVCYGEIGEEGQPALIWEADVRISISLGVCLEPGQEHPTIEGILKELLEDHPYVDGFTVEGYSTPRVVDYNKKNPFRKTN